MYFGGAACLRLRILWRREERADVGFRVDLVRFTPSFGHRSEVALTVTFDPTRTFASELGMTAIRPLRTWSSFAGLRGEANLGHYLRIPVYPTTVAKVTTGIPHICFD